jgi:Cysteine-rich secretory protein family
MTRFHPSKLLLCAATALCLFPCAVAQRFTSSPNAVSLAEQYLLSAANQERGARGLSALHRDPLLAHAATQHARLMAAHEEISHQFAGEPELTNRGANAGVAFSVISENVGEAPSVVKIHDMWMHSEHHRTNLLDPSIDSAGISVISRNGELYAVEDFARTVRSVSLAEQESAIANLIAQPGRIALADSAESVSAARRTCTMSTGYAGTRKPWFVMRFTSDSINRLPDQLRSRLTSGRYREAAVGACSSAKQSPFTSYSFAVLLYP